MKRRQALKIVNHIRNRRIMRSGKFCWHKVSTLKRAERDYARWVGSMLNRTKGRVGRRHWSHYPYPDLVGWRGLYL